jgi:ankyrin repeat protein
MDSINNQAHDVPCLFILQEAEEGPLYYSYRTLIHRILAEDNSFNEGAADINKQYVRGYTLLHLAVYANDVHSVHSLLKKGADPNIAGEHEYTPLHIAALNGYEDIITVLLVRKANACIKDQDGCTPLHLATLYHHPSIAAQLLTYDNAPLFSQNLNGITPFHIAVAHGCVELIIDFVRVGLDLECRAQGGYRALHIAAIHSCRESVDFLLSYGVEVNCKDDEGITPLLLAAGEGDVGIVECLLKNGADPNAQSQLGWTPLHVASSWGHIAIIEKLLQANANSQLLTQEDVSPLHEAARFGHTPVVQLLIDHDNTSINLVDNEQWTPLHFAAFNDDVDMVRYLLGKGADFQKSDDWQCAPLDIAIESGCWNSALLLLEASQNLQKQMMIKHGSALEDITPVHGEWLKRKLTQLLSYAYFQQAIMKQFGWRDENVTPGKRMASALWCCFDQEIRGILLILSQYKVKAASSSSWMSLPLEIKAHILTWVLEGEIEALPCILPKLSGPVAVGISYLLEKLSELQPKRAQQVNGNLKKVDSFDQSSIIARKKYEEVACEIMQRYGYRS